jgi:hypothetical protein
VLFRVLILFLKEDAVQVILDCTPGKQRLIVKPLSDQQLQQIIQAGSNPCEDLGLLRKP